MTRDLYYQGHHEGTVSIAELAARHAKKGTPAYIAVLESLMADVRAGRIELTQVCATHAYESRVSEITAQAVQGERIYGRDVLAALSTGRGAAESLEAGRRASEKLDKLRAAAQAMAVQDDTQSVALAGAIEWLAERVLRPDPKYRGHKLTNAALLADMESALQRDPIFAETLTTLSLGYLLQAMQDDLYRLRRAAQDENPPQGDTTGRTARRRARKATRNR